VTLETAGAYLLCELACVGPDVEDEVYAEPVKSSHELARGPLRR